MIWMICLLTIHSSNDKFDNRQYIEFRGQVLREFTEMYKVDFYADFKKKGIDLEYNRPVQLLKDQDCHAE